MRATTRAIAIGSAAALTFVLTACGGDTAAGPSETSASPVEAAQTGEPAESGVPVELTREEFNQVSTEAMLDVAKFRYTMSTEGGAAGLAYAYEVVREDDGGVRVAMASESQGVDVMTVMADGLYYMNLGDLSDGKYVVIDPADTENPLAGQLPDPEQLAKVGQGGEFDGSLLELEAVGVEDVEGVPTMHYVMTLDTAAYVEALSGDMGGLLEDALAQLPPTLTADAWLDAEGRTVQTVSEFQGITTTMAYSDWDDESITVDVPPVDEQIDWRDVEAGA